MKLGRQIFINSISIFVASEMTGFNLVRFVILRYVWKFPVSKSNVIIILQKLLDSVKFLYIDIDMGIKLAFSESTQKET